MGAVWQNYDLGGQVIREICRIYKPSAKCFVFGGQVLSVVHTRIHYGYNSIYKTLYCNALPKID